MSLHYGCSKIIVISFMWYICHWSVTNLSYFIFYTHLFSQIMWNNRFGLIIVVEGGLMKPAVTAGRRLNLCGTIKQRCLFLFISLTEITLKAPFSICICQYRSPSQYRVPVNIVHISLQSIFWNSNMVFQFLKNHCFNFSRKG